MKLGSYLAVASAFLMIGSSAGKPPSVTALQHRVAKLEATTATLKQRLDNLDAYVHDPSFGLEKQKSRIDQICFDRVNFENRPRDCW